MLDGVVVLENGGERAPRADSAQVHGLIHRRTARADLDLADRFGLQVRQGAAVLAQNLLLHIGTDQSRRRRHPQLLAQPVIA